MDFRCLGLFLVFFCVSVAENQHYDNYHLVKVVPLNSTHLNILQSAVEEFPDWDFWSEPTTLKNDVQVLIPPSGYGGFKTLMKENKIPYKRVSKNFQKFVDSERQASSFRSVVPIYYRTFDHTYYLNYQQVHEFLSSLFYDYPEMIDITSAGLSYENRSIPLVRLGINSTEEKPAVFIDCGIHAREWASVSTCLYLIKELTRSYGNNSDVTALLDGFDWFLMPVANPDGYVYTWETERLWRKNRRPQRKNCTGVDLNRNFDVAFNTTGVSNNPCVNWYMGTAAFSEPETMVMRDVLGKLKDRLKLFLSIHTFKQLWMAPYGHKKEKPEHFEDLERVGKIGIEAIAESCGTQYKFGRIGSILYRASGTTVDYAYDVLKVKYSYALELRDEGQNGFILPKTQILPTAKETYHGIVAAAQEILKEI